MDSKILIPINFAYLIGVVLIFGCIRSVSPPAPVFPKPAAEDNSLPGSVVGGNDLLIQYKSLAIKIENSQSIKLSSSSSKDIDFHVFTSSSPFNIQGNIDEKIFLPANLIDSIRKIGFRNVKELPIQRKILLKKEGVFVFFSAFIGFDDNKHVCYGLLFECDNGKNILVIDGNAQEDSLREFLYSMRDDGKEVDLLIEIADRIDSQCSLEKLFQPKRTLILPRSMDLPNGNQLKFDQCTSDIQLFEGKRELLIPSHYYRF